VADRNETDDTTKGGEAEETPRRTHIRPEPNSRTKLEEFSTLLHSFDKKPDDDDDQAEDDDQADGDDESREDGESKPRKAKKLKTLDELAETLGVKAASLYDVEIPSSRAGEKPYTLGMLKDLAKERDDFQLATLKLEDERREHEREKVNAEEELRLQLSVLPADQLKPESVAKVRKMLEARRAKARAEILESIQDWRDPVKRESDLQAIAEQLKGYGIHGEFLLANLSAPVMKYLRDMQRLDARVRKALAAVEERKSKGKGPGARREGGRKQRSQANGDSRAARLEQNIEAFRNAFSDRSRH